MSVALIFRNYIILALELKMEDRKIIIEIRNSLDSMPQFPSATFKSNGDEALSSGRKRNSNEFKQLPEVHGRVKRRSASFSLLKSYDSHINSEAAEKPAPQFRVGEPKADEAKELPQVKLYEVWPGKNQFLCRGQCITGPRSNLIHVILMWTLIFGVSVTYFVLAVPYLTSNLTKLFPAITSTLLLFTCAFFLLTSCCDPGIIPRKEIFELFGSVPEQFTTKVFDRYMQAHVLMSQEEKNKIIQAFKYCRTCRIFRPPRASHCAHCDNCIEVFDHHCPFVGNCIGKRNYRYFLLFLISLVIYSFIIICGFTALGLAMNNEAAFFDNKVAFYALTGILASGVLIILLLVLGLLAYHVVLAVKGQTTRENLTRATFAPSIPRPKVNICLVDSPWLDYNAVIKRRGKAENAVRPSSVPNSPLQLGKEKIVVQERKYERFDLSGE